MPMSVVYATVNGRMVQENRGGTITKYVADTLGSVIQTRNASGVQTSSTTYWPYGEVRTSTGTNPSPWGFVGTLGYFRDAMSRLYIRARYYMASIGRWNTVDPVWPWQKPYGYVDSRPVNIVDPSGLVGQGLGAALLGCFAGGVGSFIGGLVRGDSPGASLCKAGFACVAGALIAAITAEFPWLAKCLIGALSGALIGIAATVCRDRQPCEPLLKVNWPCVAASAVISGVLGCVTGGFGDDLQKALLRWINGAIQAATGSICSDIVSGRPGKFQPMVRDK